MNKLFLSCLLFLFFSAGLLAQKADTLADTYLNTLEIYQSATAHELRQLEPLKGTYIFSGKKSEVIDISRKGLAIAEKYGRQVFAKVPGVFVYDMDGTGNQTNISTRGLDPHRGWEFNYRKDGVITNSDMYGYPASHYNIPLEAVEKVELVRGTGSLQYGAQFGGMLNYVSKQPQKGQKFQYETINSAGSYGLLSSFHRVSGSAGKWRYQLWACQKRNDGYRDNNASNYNAEAATLWFEPSDRFSLRLEWTHSRYRIQIAGPLTDAMFAQNPRMSTRARSFYSPDIHVPSIDLNWKLGAQTRLQFTSSAIWGTRNSVLFDRPATVADTIVTATRQYNNRQVDIDGFNSYSNELRLLHEYRLLGLRSAITLGVQYLNNDLHRRQQGKGTTGSDYDLSVAAPGFGRDMHFRSKNTAFFVENRFQLTSRWSVNAGLRAEKGDSRMTGVISYYPQEDVPNTIRHEYVLLGGGTQFDFNKHTNAYAGFSQAYRPVIFKDIIPGSIYEKSDKNLKNAQGYNLEAGFRGRWRFLRWDIAGFALQYNNRLGTLAQETDAGGNLIILRTNIGDARTIGLEMFAQADWRLNRHWTLSVFSATSRMDGRYVRGAIRSGAQNVPLKDKKVESVPDWISRNGCTLKYQGYSLSALYSYTSASYADPLNTVAASASGSVGLVPAYGLLDFNISLPIKERFKLQLNLNNAFDKQYFTKRPQFYPGPGIWPSDGRTFSVVLSATI